MSGLGPLPPFHERIKNDGAKSQQKCGCCKQNRLYVLKYGEGVGEYARVCSWCDVDPELAWKTL